MIKLSLYFAYNRKTKEKDCNLIELWALSLVWTVPLSQSHQTCPLTAHTALLPVQAPCKPHFYSLTASDEPQHKAGDKQVTSTYNKPVLELLIRFERLW